MRDAAIQWQLKNGREFVFTYPIVAETFDFLNDANGEHVKPAHAFEALDRAKPGPVEEGAVGGGTGMGCNGFKGGIGTSSRVLTAAQGVTPSACWCSATTAAICESSACRFGPRSPIWAMHRTSATAEPAVDARHAAVSRNRRWRAETAASEITKAAGQSSSSLRPTRRCCHINSSASRGA